MVAVAEETCEDLHEHECDRQCYRAGCAHQQGYGASQAMGDFFSPVDPTDEENYMGQLIDYMFVRPNCGTGDNSLEQCECGRTGCDCVGRRTGCHADLCDTTKWGWNYVAIAQQAERMAGFTTFPVAEELVFNNRVDEIEHDGKILVYSRTARPVTQECDPCAPRRGGAVTLQSIEEIVGSSFADEIEGGVNAYLAENPPAAGIDTAAVNALIDARLAEECEVIYA